MRNRLIR
jgi:hypothetical protein